MSRPKPVEYAEASAEVRGVFDDIKARRKIAEINNFWKYLGVCHISEFYWLILPSERGPDCAIPMT